MVTLHLSRAVRTAVEPSERVCQIAAMFGLGVDDTCSVQIVPPVDLTLAPGRVIFITGASGGGKTTLLNLIREALADRDEVRVVDFDALEPPDDRPLVDLFDEPLEDTTRFLALAGLNDAFVMLRRPSELSDGQRYRLRLAQAMALGDRPPAEPGAKGFTAVLADEFGATLDRLTASVIARNVRKWTTRSATPPKARGRPGPRAHTPPVPNLTPAPICFIAATTHDDLLEPLAPDTLIVQHPGQAMEVIHRASR